MKKKGGAREAKPRHGRAMAFMTIVGTVVGAGIFGVPYVFAQSGPWLGLVYTVALGAIVGVKNLMFAEALTRVGKSVRLPGLARLMLGPRWAAASAVSAVIGYWFGLLAYLIVGGTLLAALFAGVVDLPLVVWQAIFYLSCSAVVVAGLKTVGRAELWLTGALIAVLGALVATLAPDVSLGNLLIAPVSNPFLPYGVILFALSGLASIPEARELIGGDKKALVPVIVAAVATTVLLTAAVGIVVVGVSGAGTTESMIDGLIPLVGPWVVRIGALFGLLAVSTSFFSNGLYLRDVLRLDYRVGAGASALLALGVPAVAFVAGFQHFIAVIGFSGATFWLVDATVLTLSYGEARKLKTRGLGVDLPGIVPYLTLVIFAVGLLVTWFLT